MVLATLAITKNRKLSTPIGQEKTVVADVVLDTDGEVLCTMTAAYATQLGLRRINSMEMISGEMALEAAGDTGFALHFDAALGDYGTIMITGGNAGTAGEVFEPTTEDIDDLVFQARFRGV